MTDTLPNRLRKLADYYHELKEGKELYEALLTLAAEKEAQGCDVDKLDAIASNFARLLAVHLEQLVASCPGSPYFYSESLEELAAYRDAINVVNERRSRTHMGEPVISEKDAQPSQAEVPLPEPDVRCGEYAGPAGEGASENYFSAGQMRQYGQACAKAARDAALYECAKLCEQMRDVMNDSSPLDGSRASVAEELERRIQAAKKGTT